MKNIIEEASSIIKAIEKGWEKAGKPETFSVKIYEYPQKNFIGLTTRSAKIGIFFDEKKGESERKFPEAKHERKMERHVERAPKRFERPPKVAQAHAEEKIKKTISAPTPKEDRVFWTDQMVDLSKELVTETLQTMQKSTAFGTETSKHQLIITFNKPLLPDKEKERIFLRNLSILLLQTLRNKLKRPLRGFKITLITRS